MAGYPAQPLGENEIRLLQLEPATDYKVPIRCTLRNVRLDTEPRYEALSYSWGGSNERLTITLSERPEFAVTDNLWYSLRRLRRREHVRTLWVDALCINQSDDNEKGHQVLMMFDIYQSCTRAVIWLGEPDRPAAAGTVPEDTPTDARSRALNLAICSTYPHWWDRAWVVQEVVVAREAIVTFGAHELTWGDFVHRFLSALSALDRSPHDGGYTHASFKSWMRNEQDRLKEKFTDLNRLRKDWTRGKHRLVDLAENTRSASATNARDKAYSLLGMMKPEEARLVRVDYSAPVAVAYATATYAAIKVERDFDMLSHISFQLPRIDGLPSWAVDFTQTERLIIGIAPPFGRPDIETTLKRFERSHSTEVSLSADWTKLTARGRSLDTIEQVHHLQPDAFFSEDSCRDVALQEIVSCAFRRAAENQPMHSAQRCATHAEEPWTKSGKFSPQNSRLSGHILSTYLEEVFSKWEQVTHLSSTTLVPMHLASKGMAWRLSPLFTYAEEGSGHASIFTTRKGFLGIAPSTVTTGDIVGLLYGNRLPLLLRPCHDGSYTFQGFIYVHGTLDLSLDAVEIADYWWECAIPDEDFVLS